MKTISKSASLSFAFLVGMLAVIGSCGYECINILKTDQEARTKAATEAAWFADTSGSAHQVEMDVLQDMIDFRNVLLVQDDPGALTKDLPKLQSQIATTNTEITALKKTLDGKKIPNTIDKLAAAHNELASSYQALMTARPISKSLEGARDPELKVRRAVATVIADIGKASVLPAAAGSKAASETFKGLASYMVVTLVIAWLIALAIGSFVSSMKKRIDAAWSDIAVRSANLTGAMAALRDAQTDEEMTNALENLKEGVKGLQAAVSQEQA